MAQKLTITLIVLFGLLTFGSSRPTFEDDESFSFNDEEARTYEEEGRDYDDEEARAYEEEVRAYDEDEPQAYDVEESRAYEGVPAEFMSQYEEIRQNKEGPPRLLKFSNFCYGRKDGNYADSSNPSAFYMCDKAGQTWTMNCQTGLIFYQSRNRCDWAHGSSSGKQNNYDNQPYVPLPAKEIYVPQQPVKDIYVPQQLVKEAYVPKQASSQITGYGR